MANYAKIRAAAISLNPIDDPMFRKMAEDKAFCEEILRVILGDPMLAVLEHRQQESVTNLQGRSVILDARCLLGDGRTVIVEVQKADDDDHQKRMRYNSSVLTANITDPGRHFKDIPNVCAVFIGKFDVFRENRPIYHVDRILRENGKTVHNGLEEIYVNAAVRDGSDVSELMRVFTEENAYSQKFPVTSSIKHRFKQTEEGRKNMTDAWDALMEEAVQEEVQKRLKTEFKKRVQEEVQKRLKTEFKKKVREEVQKELQKRKAYRRNRDKHL